MNLLLSLLATTSLVASTTSAPIANVVSLAKQEKLEPFALPSQVLAQGVFNISHQVSATAQTKLFHNEVQDVTEWDLEIPWELLGLNDFPNDYFNIDWENSLFALNADVYYWENIWGNSGTTVRKLEMFRGDHPTDPSKNLGMFFIYNLAYSDGSGVNGWGKTVHQTFEYSFSDIGTGVLIHAKVWASAEGKKAKNIATLNFHSLTYRLARLWPN